MKRICKFLIAVMALALLVGCGGGSSGTDGGVSLRISGKVKNTNGQSLREVVVTVQETGDQAVTDAEGSFKIETRAAEKALTLLIEKDSKEATATIDVSSANDGDTVSVELELDEANFQVGQVSVTVDSGEMSPTPIPVRDLEINGNLITQSGRAIPSFRVQVDGERSYNTTDRNGRFRLVTKKRKVSLLVSNKRHREKVTLPPIADSAAKISVSIELVFEKVPDGGIQAMDEASFRLKASVRN